MNPKERCIKDKIQIHLAPFGIVWHALFRSLTEDPRMIQRYLSQYHLSKQKEKLQSWKPLDLMLGHVSSFLSALLEVVAIAQKAAAFPQLPGASLQLLW